MIPGKSVTPNGFVTIFTWSRNKLEFQSNAAKAALVIIPEGLKLTMREWMYLLMYYL